MPKLTGKELSDLYPKAKTFDELRAENAQIQEIRRPRFVPVKVAVGTTLGAAAMLVAYYFIARVVGSLTDDALQELTTVAISGGIALGTLVVILYLRSFIDGPASKVVASMSLLYTALGVILCVAGAVSAIFIHYIGHDSLFTASLVLPFVFFITYAAVFFIIKY